MERAIRFVRDAFFAAAWTFADVDDLNVQADAWCRSQAAERRCPEDPERNVGEVFADEVPRLITLPDNPSRAGSSPNGRDGYAGSESAGVAGARVEPDPNGRAEKGTAE